MRRKEKKARKTFLKKNKNQQMKTTMKLKKRLNKSKKSLIGHLKRGNLILTENFFHNMIPEIMLKYPILILLSKMLCMLMRK